MSDYNYIKVSPENMNLIETLANDLIAKGVRPCIGDPAWDNIHATIYNPATKQYSFKLAGQPDTLYELEFGVINKIFHRVHNHFNELENENRIIDGNSNIGGYNYIKVSPDDMVLIEMFANHLIGKGVRPCMGYPAWDNIHATIYDAKTKQYSFRLEEHPNTIYQLEFGVINKILTKVHRHFDEIEDDDDIDLDSIFANRKSNSTFSPFDNKKDKDVSNAKTVSYDDIKDPKTLKIPGRPELEKSISDILDYFYRPDDYKKMGVNPPNGVLFYGPPGTGKSHTAKIIVDFLGWNLYEMNIGSTASHYMHKTSTNIKELFDEAEENAPSIILMEEIDSLAGSRDGLITNESKIEEINEMLRALETAAEKNILVLGTTNRLDALDPAVTRTGRFDSKIEINKPNKQEIILALQGLLKNRSVEEDLPLEKIAQKLVGHSMSDVAWLVNEAAKNAIKGNKDAIDDWSFKQAISAFKKNVA